MEQILSDSPQRKQPCQHPDLKLTAFQNVRKKIKVTQFVGPVTAVLANKSSLILKIWSKFSERTWKHTSFKP